MLITGATGFVGQQVVSALVRMGVPVRALLRHGARLPIEGSRPYYVSDLLSRHELADALEGVGTVVHLAGRAHVIRDSAADPLAEFRRVNVHGTRVVLEEALNRGVRRFIYVSSVAAVGGQGQSTLTDGTPARPLSPYGMSKLEAEIVIRELALRAGIHAPILRPPLTYGPGMKGNPLRLFGLIARGIPLPLGMVKNRRSFVYVGNLVAAILTVLGHSATGQETFFVSDGHDLSTPEFIRAIARALGKPARLISIPPALFRLVGSVGDSLTRLMPFPLTSEAVNSLLGSLVVDSSRLSRVTGFRPPFSLEEGLRLTAEWYNMGRTKRN